MLFTGKLAQLMVTAWIIGLYASAPGTKQCTVIQSFSNATTGVQGVKLPLHIADNSSCDLGFHFKVVMLRKHNLFSSQSLMIRLSRRLS